MGNPLCDKRQYRDIIGSFLRYIIQEENLRPIWLLVSEDVEEILGNDLGWRTLTCIAEERVNRDSGGDTGGGKKCDRQKMQI